jgi:pSer/pThr/pTyr-binding forkhead associated (FHA) protein
MLKSRWSSRWQAATTTSSLSPRRPRPVSAVQAAARQAQTPVTRIGRIDADPGLRLLDAAGALLERRYASFDHFA